MKIKEAIERLETLKAETDDKVITDIDKEAIDLAVKALEEKETNDKILKCFGENFGAKRCINSFAKVVKEETQKKKGAK